MDIDKDIELVSNLKNVVLKGKVNEHYIYTKIPEEYLNAIENVLKELEIKDKMIDFMADFIVENIDRIDTKPWCRFLVYDSSSKWLSSGKKKKSL